MSNKNILQIKMKKAIKECSEIIKNGDENDKEKCKAKTLIFFETALKEQNITLFSTEEIDKYANDYNSAFWEDVEVETMEKLFEMGGAKSSDGDKKKNEDILEDLKKNIDENNERKKKEGKKNQVSGVAFRHSLSSSKKMVNSGKRNKKIKKMGWLFPFYAFIMEDEYVTDQIEIDKLKKYKLLFIALLILGENKNEKNKCMTDALLSIAKSNIEELINQPTDWIEEFEKLIEQDAADILNYLHDEKNQLNYEKAYDQISLFCGNLNKIETEVRIKNNYYCGLQKIIDYKKWFKDKLNDIDKFTESKQNEMQDKIIRCLDMMKKDNKKWRGEKIKSPNYQYLIDIVHYSEEKNIIFNKALFLKSLDDLTDWVLYEQWLNAAKNGEDNIVAGRIDYRFYSGIALREEGNSIFAQKNMPDLATRSNFIDNDFWRNADLFKTELVEMLSKPMEKCMAKDKEKYREYLKNDDFERYNEVYERLFHSNERIMENRGKLYRFVNTVYGEAKNGLSSFCEEDDIDDDEYDRCCESLGMPFERE